MIGYEFLPVVQLFQPSADDPHVTKFGHINADLAPDVRVVQ